MKWKRGDLIADKYRVIDRLGEGGMGVVLLAQHELLGRPVAVKVMHQVQDDPVSRERFLREGRIMSQVSSPHVVRLNDVGSLPNGQLFLVMERLDGRDLQALLDGGGPMAIPAAVDVILQALDALAEAHSLGIVHRDLKPANLFLAQERGHTVVKVLDFGISKALKAVVALTSTGTMMGSPLYMSPEQVRSAKAVHVETDIWALGVVLFEALAGQPPFNGNTAGEVFGLILDAQMPPLASMRPDVPPGLLQVITRCLAKKPADRYASCGDLATALAPFGTGACASNVARAVSYAPQAFASTVHAGSGAFPQPPISAGTLPLGSLPLSSSSQSIPRKANASTQQSWSNGAPLVPSPSRSPATTMAIAVGVLGLLAAGVMGAYLVLLRRHRDSADTTTITATASKPPPAVSTPPEATPLPTPTASTASTPTTTTDPMPTPAPTASTPEPDVSAQPASPSSAMPTKPRPHPGKKPVGDTSRTRD